MASNRLRLILTTIVLVFTAAGVAPPPAVVLQQDGYLLGAGARRGYQERVVDDSSLGSRTPLSTASFREHCTPIESGYAADADIRVECSVLELARVDDGDPAGDSKLWYALYRYLVSSDEFPVDQLSLELYDHPPTNRTAIVLFRETVDDTLQPLWADARGDGLLGGVFYDTPAIVASLLGSILWIPVRHTGTGHFNEDHWFLSTDAGWTLLDTWTWQEDLTRRLPEDHAVWKGVVLDLANLRAETALWRAGDANCCPSGGRAEIEFELRDDVLVIEQVRRFPE